MAGYLFQNKIFNVPDRRLVKKLTAFFPFRALIADRKYYTGCGKDLMAGYGEINAIVFIL